MSAAQPRISVDWAALDGAVRGWLRRRVPAGAVEDLAQETLLRVHRTLPADVRSPDAWALRTAHSVLVDYLRKPARRADVATDPDVLAALAPLPPDDATDRPDAGLDAEADRLLDRAIAKCLGVRVDGLPEAQRQALLLTGPGDLTQAEAAAQEGVSVPGMKSRVQRASRTVRSQAESCCAFELDARGRPIDMHPRDGEQCTCGCAD
jgi:RNA polymerase sigma-70 factor (ECF subfamily)